MDPTFVIAGGQRCGTTSLYRILDKHPEVYMARPLRPEPKYFVHDPEPGRDRGWYVSTYFADTGDARSAGEKSTSYLQTPGAARRMKQQFPNLRVVVILRHPVERAVSNYRFSVRNGLETKSFAKAIAAETERLEKIEFEDVSAHPFGYVQRGRYIEHLSAYSDLFSPDHLLVVLHDDLAERPGELIRQLYTFIGVDAAFKPSEPDRRHNAHSRDGLRVERRLLTDLCRQFADSNRGLARLLGRDLTRWSRLPPELEAACLDSGD